MVVLSNENSNGFLRGFYPKKKTLHWQSAYYFYQHQTSKMSGVEISYLSFHAE
jgi:hypothetical protein